MAVLGFLILLAFWIAYLFIPKPWSSARLSAQVTGWDGQPVPGALVVVSWNAVSMWFSSDLGTVHAAEAVTDAAGRFVIPAWGGTYIEGGALGSNQPRIYVYKEGITPLVISRQWRSSFSISEHATVTELIGGKLRMAPRDDGEYRDDYLTEDQAETSFIKAAADLDGWPLPRMKMALKELEIARATRLPVIRSGPPNVAPTPSTCDP
ncbi:hypothetical protein SAMN05428948_0604 [Massilia sp. CF038]|nr:hypothetical protein SAMN05428948_0604 [Massilia sp. CF038]